MVPSTAHEPSASLESPIEQNLPLPLEQPLPLGPPVPQAASFEPTTSFEPEGSLSDESLGHLGSILGRLTCDGPFMPIPLRFERHCCFPGSIEYLLINSLGFDRKWGF
jgi:hypothetical protein